MIHLVTFADEKMSRAMALCKISAEKNGVDLVNTFIPKDIDRIFYENNKQVIDSERGAGYWLWKAYAVNEIMKHVPDNDYLIYSDAGIEFIAPVQEIINRMDEDIFFFTNGWPHVEWCKMDVLYGILKSGFTIERTFSGDIINVDEKLKNIKQVQASVIFFRVNQRTRDFVKEWLLWCQMPGFIDDSPSKMQNYPTFAEHRHDQAILSCLQIKYGYKLHRWPTIYSEHLPLVQPTDNYPPLYNHHRKRDSEW
jgi:hypothetical protein